jgi:Fe2+ or Zn2+ uptake regulation protein
VTADLHEAVAARLANHDGRYTGARRDLIEALSAAGCPLTVDEIVVRAPGQRPSSVYRNLAVFEAEGIVHRLAGVGEFARFELTEALVGHHHHLACRECGAMTDVHLPSELEGELDRVLSRVARAEGFELSSHVLDAVGTCRACSEAARAASAPPKSSRRSVS